MNIFLLSSTLKCSSQYSVFDTKKRYEQTLDTIHSIRKNCPESFLILIDNSPEEIDEDIKKCLESKVDVFKSTSQDEMMKQFNLRSDGDLHWKIKSVGETYNLLQGIATIEDLKLIPKRIFKITARYRLKDSFNPMIYEEESRYVFKSNEGRDCFETIFWSFGGEKIEHAKSLLKNVLDHILANKHKDIETSIFHLIEKDEVLQLNELHYAGICAPNGIQIDG